MIDECLCGFGRTGAWFGCDREAVVPDLMVVSKALSSAFPIAGVVGREELMGDLPVGLQSTTFEGNPVACAAAAANIRHLISIDAPACARAIEATLDRNLSSWSSSIVGDVRGVGALWGLEIVQPGTSVPRPDLARRIRQEAMMRGLPLYSGGHYGNVVGIVPPLGISQEDIEAGLSILQSSIAVVESAVRPEVTNV